MSFSVLRLSLHPVNRVTVDGHRYLRLSVAATGTVMYRRTISDVLLNTSVIVPKDQKTAIALGHVTKNGGKVEWSEPVIVDPRAKLEADFSVNVRVTAVRDFETQEAAQLYVSGSAGEVRGDYTLHDEVGGEGVDIPFGAVAEEETGEGSTEEAVETTTTVAPVVETTTTAAPVVETTTTADPTL